jgi:choline dehydrogenase-like flavoprotein
MVFTDARGLSADTELSVDLCIVGAGAAGITLADELAGSGISTLLLEAGGLEYDEASQQFYEGPVDSNVLFDDYLKSSRLRYFGGTTNHWGGHSVVINEHIFGQRPGVPQGHWPINAEDLRPFYRRAAEQLGAQSTVPEHRVAQPKTGLLAMERYPIGGDQMRMGSYFPKRWANTNIRVLLNASVTGLMPNPNGRAIQGAMIQTLTGVQFNVRAHAFVLAAGAIENARLLMLPTNAFPAGIGNQSGRVGRGFADHLYGSGEILETGSGWSGSDQEFFALSPALQHANQSHEVAMLRRRDTESLDPEDAVISTLSGLVDSNNRAEKRRVDYYFEVPQDPQNRVSLSERKDPFGQPHAALRFVVGADIKAGFQRSMIDLALAAGRYGLGRLRLNEGSFVVGSHHLHTTRMGDDPKTSVVDSNGRLHGMANIFVAGSSVFPSAGAGNPTFPLVALTIRLADHLTSEFRANGFGAN